MKTIPFAIATKIVKYLGANLTKVVKDLYTEHNETLLKEIEENNISSRIFITVMYSNSIRIKVNG